MFAMQNLSMEAKALLWMILNIENVNAFLLKLSYDINFILRKV